MFRSVLISIVCFASHAADFAIGAGAGPASGNARADPAGRDVRPEIAGTVLLNAGLEFLRHKSPAIAMELPLALHGSRSSEVFARSGSAVFYTERLIAVLTPGVRVRFGPEWRLSPWLSFGAGLAIIRRTGVTFRFAEQIASQSDNSPTVALAPAAGVDIRVGRRWFIRGELRNYFYRTPATDFASSRAFWNRWNYNPVVAGSLGLRLLN